MFMKQAILFLALFISAVSFGQQKVTAPLVRNAPTDTTYAILADTLLYGGHQFVNDTLVRNAIPIAARKKGMWVTAANTGVTYKLSESLGDWSTVIFGADSSVFATLFKVRQDSITNVTNLSLKENLSNKVNVITTPNATDYPTTGAVNGFVASSIAGKTDTSKTKADSANAFLNLFPKRNGNYNGVSGRLKARLDIGDTTFTSTDSIYFCGDSYIAAHIYPPIVTASIGGIMVNKGYAGTGVLRSFGAAPAWINRLSEIPTKTSNRKLLFFGLGTNDIVYTDTASWRAGYNTIIDDALAKGWDSSNIKIIGIPQLGSAITARKTIFDTCIATMKLQYKFQIIDIAEFQRQNGGLSLLSSDSLHPSTVGYQMFAYGIISALNLPSVGQLRVTGNIVTGTTVTPSIFKTGDILIPQGAALISVVNNALNRNFFSRIIPTDSIGGIMQFYNSRSGYEFYVPGSGAIGTAAHRAMLIGSNGATTFTKPASVAGNIASFRDATFNRGFDFSFPADGGEGELKAVSQLNLNGTNGVFAKVNGTTVVSIYNSNAANGGLLVSLGGGLLNNNSLFDVQSVTKASIPAPKMTTTQRNAIPSAVSGFQTYDITVNRLSYHDGTAWQYVAPLANPVFTGTVTLSTTTTGTAGTDSVLVKTSAGVVRAVSPTFYSRLSTSVIGGSISATVTAVTTFIPTIPTQANNTYQVVITPSNALTAVNYYVTNKTTTSFDVVFTSALTGTVAFDWILKP